jgi:uncharacterized protein (TIGR02145 family)
MKKCIFIIVAISAIALAMQAQNDIMYIMKDGMVVGQYNVNTEIDSIIFYEPEVTVGTYTDSRDGNVYKTVTIGGRVWMAENLRYLPEVIGSQAISKTVPYYYVYGYEGMDVEAAKATENYNTYGVLYNWPSAIDACPSDDGWHLSTADDWSQIKEIYNAGELKATGTIEDGTGLWASPNSGANNESGFTALPGGHRYYFGDEGFYLHLGEYGYWWTATVDSYDDPFYQRMDYNKKSVSGDWCSKRYGYSVRCVKD